MLALTSIWAIILASFLASDAVGHDCSVVDHSGELPSLLLTATWALGLVAALAVPNPPVSRLTVRLAMPLLTVGLVGGTIIYIFLSQNTGC